MLCAGAHGILDAGQLSAQAASRMIASEISGCEISHLADQQRQCIANGHQDSGAGRGRQTKRTCFLDRAQSDAQIGSSTERTGGSLGDGNQDRSQPAQRGNQPQDFLGLTTLGEGNHDIIRANPAQVTVNGFGRMERKCSGAG